jgi:hypothetical protein
MQFKGMTKVLSPRRLKCWDVSARQNIHTNICMQPYFVVVENSSVFPSENIFHVHSLQEFSALADFQSGRKTIYTD